MCEFVNHIRARERCAVDSDPQVVQRAAAGVETHCGPAHDLGWLATASVDVVFASNVFDQGYEVRASLSGYKDSAQMITVTGTMTTVANFQMGM